MKKSSIALMSLAAVAVLAFGCATQPKPEPQAPAQPLPAPAPTPQVKSYPPQILEHKGTAFGRSMPSWIDAALDGSRAVEKLPEFAGQFVVIVQQEGADRDAVELIASRMSAQAVIAQMISTRVKDNFAGAQVGDKDKLETYVERCIKSSADARFTGFGMASDTWVKLQTFTPEGKPDKQVYRVIQIWTVEKAILQEQIARILKDAAAVPEEQTPDKQKAIDLVQQSFMSGF